MNSERKRIAVVVSDEFLRRLTPALFSFVRGGRDYWVVDIGRPVGELRRLVKAMRPAGILTEELPGKTKALLELGLPTVVADSDEARPGAVCIDINDRQVGERAAAFFLAAKFRHFAFLGNKNTYSGQRLEGYRRALSRAGHDCEVFIDDEKKGGAYMEYFRAPGTELTAWLRRLPRPVALFAAHDPQGRHACEACRECGIEVPSEVAIVGANDDEMQCNLSFPPLSSVAIPWLNIGRRAAELLDGLIASGAHAGRAFQVVAGEVITRESSDFTALEDGLVRRALQMLQQSHSQPITIQSLCRDLKVNRRTLEIRFRAVLGRTPREELERQRVNRAKLLLAQTDYKMPWIAEQCGFNDAERLSVVFRKVTGVPPSVYRSGLSAGE